MSNIVPQDISTLIDKWMKLEQEGITFPVDFDAAWKIAGYSRKDSARRYLPKSSQGAFFHVSVEKTGGRGRPKEVISLSCDGLKHLCLMADTEQGNEIRQYFIEAEKKWKLVQQHRPDVAQDIEILKLKAEIAKNERDKAAIENRTIELRHAVVTTCPEPVQQKILGYQVVEKVEYRDRIIQGDEVVRAGDTLNKTELCNRYGLITRNGKPDYRRLNKILNSLNLPSEAWKLTASIRENTELREEYLDELDSLLLDGDRQMWRGE